MIHTGDCIEVMAGMPAESVDAVVTDPPYGLEFMGKGWDKPSHMAQYAKAGENNSGFFNHSGHGRLGMEWKPEHNQPFQAWCTEWGREALRVTKPGGYLLAFGSSRTHHRLTSGLEDAGWVIRDTCVWIMASGFPKSRNVTKDLEQAVPEDARCVCDPRSTRTALDSQDGYRPERGSDDGRPHPVGDNGPASAPLRAGVRGRSRGGPSEGDPVLGLEHSPDPASTDHPSTESSPDRASRQSEDSPVSGTAQSGKPSSMSDLQDGSEVDRTPAYTPSTQRSADDSVPSWSPPRGDAFPYSKCTTCGGWRVAQGLGTALKPAAEFIVMARKPMVGNVAANVAQYGTGSLGIDATRIAAPENVGRVWTRGGKQEGASLRTNTSGENEYVEADPAGRWPSNLLLSDPELFDEPNPEVVGSGATVSSPASYTRSPGSRHSKPQPMAWGEPHEYETVESYGDSGGYSRFFIVPKAGRSDREPVLRPDGHEAGKRFSIHPTMKPVDLMRHLIRLVTPTGGTILDPFLGSGTTGIAAEMEGFAWIGIEQDAGYVAIAEARLNGVQRGLGLDVPAPTRKRPPPQDAKWSMTRDKRHRNPDGDRWVDWAAPEDAA